GQNRQVQIREALRNLLGVRSGPSISGEINRDVLGLQNETAPQTLVAIEGTATGEVLCRHSRDPHVAARGGFLPPVKLHHVPDTVALENAAVSQSGVNCRPMFACQMP